jgi:glucuronate isomerase
MTAFIHKDFLLDSVWARRLYHEFAADLPILDYHSHLPPEQVASDKRFRSITELWLEGDHYKWRAMRAAGVDESQCTGTAGDWEKFQAWSRTVPRTLRNPLYHWTHLELAFPFGIHELLSESTAARIYHACNERLTSSEFSACGLLRQFGVEAFCTTDDPVDDLAHHFAYQRSGASPRMYPTWRPDSALGVSDPVTYNAWLDRLAACSGRNVDSYEQLLDALAVRHAYFHEHGCRLSDHGLVTVPDVSVDRQSVQRTFAEARIGKAATRDRANEFQLALLHELAAMDHGRGWVQQFHIGAIRNNNTRQFRALGPNAGFDSIGDETFGAGLQRLLDGLEQRQRLGKTIVYNLNPKDNEMLVSLLGNFQAGPSVGKLQFGAAWWFLDQLSGMTRQLDALSSLGLLSSFVGMLTDSRSFVSYSRHEYFRRLLCNLLGSDIERGLLPSDADLIGHLVRDVCYFNAKRYFDWA